jgi:hypothetical protein
MPDQEANEEEGGETGEVEAKEKSLEGDKEEGEGERRKLKKRGRKRGEKEEDKEEEEEEKKKEEEEAEAGAEGEVEEEKEDKKPPIKAEYKQFRSPPTNKCAKKLEELLNTTLFRSALVCGFFILTSYF